MSKEDVNREEKVGINTALQYYKILSYKTFYRKVLGEKMLKKIDDNNKLKLVIKKLKKVKLKEKLL